MKQNVTKQETLLEYDIANSLCGQGNINTIREENGFWRSYIGAETTRVKCRLKNICTPIYIQMRIQNASLIDLTCYNDKEEQSNQLIHFSAKQRSSKQKLYFQFKKIIPEVDQICLDLHSYNKKQIEILMIRFYGKVVRKRSNNAEAKDLKKINSQIFKERMKQKSVKANKTQNQKQHQDKQIIQKAQKKQPQQSKVDNINPQDKRAAQVGIFLPQNYEKDELLSQEDIEKQGNYKISLVKQEQINRIMNVNQKWLECQRKLQASFGVKTQHKLSIIVNPKCFHGTKFCLANIYGQEKSRYVKMVKELGGLVRQEPSQNCVVATSHPKGSSLIGMARLMAGTIIVRLCYIEDCYKRRQKIKFKPYEFSPEEFLI